MANPFKEAEKKKKKTPGNVGEATVQKENPPVAEEIKEEPVPQAVEPAVKEEPVPPQIEPEKQEEPQKEEPQPLHTVKAAVQTEGKTIAEHFSEYQKEYYGGGRQEYVEARKQFTLTPALSKRLNKAVKTKEVRSANVLVNFLLEKYFTGELTLKEKE